MTERPAEEPEEKVHPPSLQNPETQEPGLVDGLRFLYQRRAALMVRFVVFFGIGLLGLLYYRLTSPTVVTGTLNLGFQGMERGEYPSGKRFSVEDFRSPDLLAKALGDAGIGKDTLDIRELAARVLVTPVVPAEIQGRWRIQEKNGVKREEYSPTEFEITIQVAALRDAQRVRLFDALVKRYLERVKSEQKAALNFVGNADISYEKLATRYDFWDIPSLFSDTSRSLNEQLGNLITESLKYQDSKYQLAFRNLAKELDIWHATRLTALEAVTYQGKLVKNREIMMRRVEYQIADLDIQIKQATEEASRAERLLGLIEHPKALLVGELSSKEVTPLVDASVLEKLIKSDFVGPVIDRITELQKKAEELGAEKSRLQEQLVWLPKANNVELAQLPSGYKEMVEILSSELTSIIQDYNRLLDEYLTATTSSLVIVKQSPLITRLGYSTILAVAGIVLVSLFLAVFMISVEHMFRRARLLARETRG